MLVLGGGDGAIVREVLKQSAKQVRAMSLQTLRQMPLMQRQMQAARQQAADDGDALQRTYPDLRLKRFAVVAVGLERLWWEAVGE